MNQHPDTEALSAHLDGEAPEWTAHVVGCPDCRAQLERLRVVATAVGQPVPEPRTAVRDAAIARALSEATAAAGPERPDRAGDTGPGESAEPVSEPALPLAPRPAVLRRSSRPVWVAAGSVAAAVLAVVGALSLVNRKDDASDTTTALQAAPNTATTTVPQAERTFGADEVVDGGDLGELPDDAALADRVTSAVAGAAGRLAADAEAGDSPAAAARIPGSGEESSANEGATSDASPPAATSGPRNVGTRACEIEARQADPGLREVVYAATGQKGGVPVMVLGFALPPEATTGSPPSPAPPVPDLQVPAPQVPAPQVPAPQVKVMVLAQSGCRLLSQSVAR